VLITGPDAASARRSPDTRLIIGLEGATFRSDVCEVQPDSKCTIQRRTYEIFQPDGSLWGMETLCASGFGQARGRLHLEYRGSIRHSRQETFDDDFSLMRVCF